MTTFRTSNSDAITRMRWEGFMPSYDQLCDTARSVIEAESILSLDQARQTVLDAFEDDSDSMTEQEIQYAAATVRWLIEQAMITFPAA